MGYINSLSLGDLAVALSRKEIDEHLFSYIQIMNKFGVAGFDKVVDLSDVSAVLARMGIPHHSNVQKRLIWFVDGVAPTLHKLFQQRELKAS